MDGIWYLVGGFNPFEKYARQNGNLPQIGVKINKKYLKPPPGYDKKNPYRVCVWIDDDWCTCALQHPFNPPRLVVFFLWLSQPSKALVSGEVGIDSRDVGMRLMCWVFLPTVWHVEKPRLQDPWKRRVHSPSFFGSFTTKCCLANFTT